MRRSTLGRPFAALSAWTRRRRREEGSCEHGRSRSSISSRILATLALSAAAALLLPAAAPLPASASTGPEQAALSWATPFADRHDTSYNELCLTFVFAAWAAAGVNLRPDVTVPIDSNTYPVDIWGHFSSGTTGSGTPPFGALVFFASKTGDRTLSHVALSSGDGNLVSTSDAVAGYTHYETVSQHSYAMYLGWWLPDGSSGSIHIAGTGGQGVNLRPGPSTTSGTPVANVPDGASPDYVCWTTGEVINGVDVWFKVTWQGATGYYASYYDDSHYSTDSDITGKYNIQPCPTQPPVIHVNSPSGTPLRDAPATTAHASGSLPDGSSPNYICWTVAERVGTVDVWFKVSYQSITGFYASYYDDSSYASDADITWEYGIRQCTAADLPTSQVRRPAPLLGVDKASAPPLDQLEAWYSTSLYRAVGVYLPVGLPQTDNRADKVQANLTPAWVEEARRMGWSLIPIYFGLQGPASCFPADYWHMSSDPATAERQGEDAGRDAVASAARLGLPAGSPVYLDLEPYSGGCAAEVMAYADGYDKSIAAAGYTSGVYGSTGSTMTDLQNKTTDGQFHVPDAIWVATNDGVPSVEGLSAPADGLWVNHQRIVQYLLDTAESHGGVTWSVDLDAIDGPVVGPIVDLPDTIKPTSQILGSGSVATLASRVTVRWTGSDNSGHVSSYTARVRTGDRAGRLGPWMQGPTTSATSWRIGLSPGTSSCVAVRATDAAGNVGAWSAARCYIRGYDDRALRASRGWIRTGGSAFANGTASAAKTSGATLTVPVVSGAHPVTQATVWATVCPGCGTVGVYIGTRRVTVLSLRSRRTYLSKPFTVTLAPRVGTVVIRTQSSALVKLDGVAVARRA